MPVFPSPRARQLTASPARCVSIFRVLPPLLLLLSAFAALPASAQPKVSAYLRAMMAAEESLPRSVSGAKAAPERPASLFFRRYAASAEGVSKGVSKGVSARSSEAEGVSEGSSEGFPARLSSSPSSPRRVTFLAKTSAPDAIRRHGGRILDNIGDIYIADAPVRNLRAMSLEPSILRMEAGAPCSALMDGVPSLTHADRLWHLPVGGRGETGLIGRGVMIGVMDVGFDISHPAFLSADGIPRVAAFWDQLDTLYTGHAVTGTDTVYVGRQYTSAEEIMQKAFSADSRFTAHGSHTSSTALILATSHAEPFSTVDALHARFMSPEPREGATLCLVSNYTADGMDAVSPERRELYNSATDILGFKYIFDRAAERSMPCVINFSEGSSDDLFTAPLYAEAITRLTGPGRIICAAAGNKAASNTFLSKPRGRASSGAFVNNGSDQAMFIIAADSQPVISLAFYDDVAHTKRNAIYDLTELADKPLTVMSDTIDTESMRYIVYAVWYPSALNDGRTAAEFLIQTADGSPMADAVAMRLHGSGNAIEAYAVSGFFRTDSHDETLDDATPDHNILFPASVERVVTVGASAYRSGRTNWRGDWMASTIEPQGERVRFSSCGPTMSGLTKPDIMAPGTSLVAAFNSRYEESNPDNPFLWNVKEFDFNGRRYAWNANSGTSMACPVVTGIIAQWLELCPTLSPDDIKTVFAATASHYDDSLTYPNNEYGHGGIDALAGARYIMDHFTGITDINAPTAAPSPGRTVWYDTAGRKLSGRPSAKGIYMTAQNGSTGRGVRKVILR